MMEDLLAQLLEAQDELDPQFKALRGAMASLKTAVRLASEEKPDALPMHKALVKLEEASADVESEHLHEAVAAFSAVTQNALDDLAFDFAKDLRESFAQRGITVEGRPPVLTVGDLTFKIEMASRKGQWLYGQEALTKPIPLSLTGILKAYDRMVKRIVDRELDSNFLSELRQAWQDTLNKRKSPPKNGRMNIIEVYSQLILNRQSNRFWNQPSRSTFKDYERDLFVRDLVLAQEQGDTPFRLGVATKSQAEQASRSLWIPKTAVDGDYYSEITFE